MQYSAEIENTDGNSGSFRRTLTISGLTAVAIGSCIGSGIFRTPSTIAGHLMQPGLIMLVWILGSVIGLAGALTYAELGSRFPGVGGMYVYLRRAYGDLVAFLFGWCTLTIVTSGAIAALGLVFAEFLSQVIPMGQQTKLAVSSLAIIFLSAINIRGVDWSQFVAKWLTGLKLLGIGLIILAGLAVARNFSGATPASPSWTTAVNLEVGLPSAFALALVGVFWSFGGWHHASYLAGETINPRRNVPRAMITGVSVVAITYLLANLAYLYLLPMDQLAASDQPAADAMSALFSWGADGVAVLVALSVFGTIAINTLTAPRIYFQMASDKVFFPQLARIHPNWRTPVTAIAFQSTWALVLLFFFQTFADLITYVVFVDVIFHVLTCVSVFIFRRREKLGLPNSKGHEEKDGYRTIGFPLVPAFYVLSLIVFLVLTLTAAPPWTTFSGLGLLAIGCLLYWLINSRRNLDQSGPE